MAKVNLRGNETGIALGATSTPLQIKIYSTGATSVPQDGAAELGGTGVISFDMNSQRVGINGKWFGTSSADFTTISTKVEKMLEALDENGMVTIGGTDDAPTYTTTDVIGIDNNGVITIGTGTAAITGTNVAEVVTGVKNALDALETSVNSMTGTATGGATSDGKHVEVTVTVGATGPAVTVNEADIASATGLAAVKTTAEQAKATADTAVQSVNEKTGTAITLNGADLNVGPAGDTGAYGQSSIQVAIQDLAAKYNSIDKDSFVHSGSLVYGPATGIEGKHVSKPSDVADTKSAIATDPYIELVIKEHQSDESQETVEAYVYIKATSLVDIYGGATGTVTGTTGDSSTEITVNGTGISAAVTIKNATETGAVTGAIQAGATGIEDYVQVANSISVTTTAGTVTDAGLGAGVSVDKAGAAKKAYDTALGTTSDATGASTIYGANKAAAAAQSTANDAQTEAAKHTTVTGNASDSYITITTGTATTGGTQYTVQTTGIDTAISTAEQNAKNYADTIISWEVI